MSHKRALAAGAKVHASALPVGAAAGAPTVTDPIFAALDALRSANAKYAAALRTLSDRDEREGRPLDEEWPEWKRWCITLDQETEAKYAVCAMVPTTAAGAVAFVRFLASDMIFDEVEFGYYGAEEATRQALSNLDHVLTRLAAGAM